jgi:hypothetical protein
VSWSCPVRPEDLSGQDTEIHALHRLDPTSLRNPCASIITVNLPLSLPALLRDDPRINRHRHVSPPRLASRSNPAPLVREFCARSVIGAEHLVQTTGEGLRVATDPGMAAREDGGLFP